MFILSLYDMWHYHQSWRRRTPEVVIRESGLTIIILELELEPGALIGLWAANSPRPCWYFRIIAFRLLHTLSNPLSHWNTSAFYTCLLSHFRILYVSSGCNVPRCSDIPHCNCQSRYILRRPCRHCRPVISAADVGWPALGHFTKLLSS